MFLLSSLLLLAAEAAEPVFIAPFNAVDNESIEMADNLADVILDTLDRNSEVTGFSVDDMKPIHDIPASDYMRACLTDEFVGCAFVVGKGSDMKYSVTGRVSSLERGSEVDVRIIEVATAREVFQVTMQVMPNGEDLFAETVSETISGVVSGRIGQEVDLREEETEEKGPDQEEVQAMDDYTRDEGGAETVDERVEVKLDEKKLTEQDLEYMMMMEGSKEWDRLGMKPKEYMAYYNSGMSLGRWRDLNRGRKGQVLIRTDLGVARGLFSSKYYGRLAKSNIDLSVIDKYAWQTLENSSGLDVTGAVSYGLIPELDIGIMGGITTGALEIDIHNFVIGQFSAVPPSRFDALNTSYVGLQALYTPLVMPTVRPVIGGQLVHYRSQFVNVVDGDLPYPAFPAANYTSLEVVLGGELRVNEYFDIFTHVPMGFVFNYNNAPSVEQQNAGILSVNLSDEDVAKVAPPERFNRVGIGLNIGLQFRIPVVNEKVNALDLYE